MKTQSIIIMFFLTCLVLSTTSLSLDPSRDPNNVKAVVYAHNKNDPSINGPDDPGYVHEPLISRTYTDGLGREIQSRVKLPDNDYLIVSHAYDDIGRMYRAFKSTTRHHPDNDNFFPLDDIEEFHYSETMYDNTPLSRVKGLGAPGKEYSLDQTEGHPTLFWYYGVAHHLDFIPSSTLRDDNYTLLLNDWPNAPDAKYFLTVIKHPNSHSFSQQITDIFGNVISTWADPDLNTEDEDDEIIAVNDYFLLGNIGTEKPPEYPDVDVNNYSYNTLGQLIKTSTADAGEVTYEYSQTGQLLAYEDENLRKESEILATEHGSDCTDKITVKMVNVYDFLGRLKEIKKQISVQSPCTFTPEPQEIIKVRNIYDHYRYITPDDREGTFFTDAILQNLKNTRGRLIYTIIYSDSKNDLTVRKIVTAFSYNEDGNISKKYLSIPGLRLQSFTYTYDLQGKVLTQVYNNGSTDYVIEYKYNHQGLVVTYRIIINIYLKLFFTPIRHFFAIIPHSYHENYRKQLKLIIRLPLPT